MRQEALRDVLDRQKAARVDRSGSEAYGDLAVEFGVVRQVLYRYVGDAAELVCGPFLRYRIGARRQEFSDSAIFPTIPTPSAGGFGFRPRSWMSPGFLGQNPLGMSGEPGKCQKTSEKYLCGPAIFPPASAPAWAPVLIT